MGKPKYTAGQIIDAIRAAGGVVAVAARALGCDRQTVYNYAERHPTVRAALDEANEVNLDVAEAGLASYVRGKVNGREVDDRVRMDALKFYLRTKGRARGYGDRADVDLTTGGKPIDAALLDSILARLDAEAGDE